MRWGEYARLSLENMQTRTKVSGSSWNFMGTWSQGEELREEMVQCWPIVQPSPSWKQTLNLVLFTLFPKTSLSLLVYTENSGEDWQPHQPVPLFSPRVKL